MKSINIIQWTLSVLICFTVVACSNETYEFRERDSDNLYITTSLDGMNLPSNLKCDLYIFWRSTGETDYIFKENITLTDTQTKIKFMNSELKDKEYKFLFVATSAAYPEINVTNISHNALTIDERWSDMLINTENLLLSSDNYSGILDKTGEEILKSGTIDGILTRMVGQIVLDIFRIDSNIDTPIDIQSADVSSVLDRVFKVEVEYQNITKDVFFNESNAIIGNNTWTEKYTQTYNLNTDGQLKVAIPQSSNGLDISPIGTLGSARMKGIYCLPADKNMRLKFTFHYYDTTPTCANADNGLHTADCFDKRTLVLHLPQEGNDATLLSVYPNYFTVNKAGIRLDRIIDVAQTGSFELVTIWGN